MKSKKSSNNLKYLSQILVVLALALILVIYVGFGEAYRTYPRFKIESVKALSEIVKKSIETFLNAGLPLKQYIGFSSIANPIIDSDDSVYDMSVLNNDGEVIFSSLSEEELEQKTKEQSYRESRINKRTDDFSIVENKLYYRVLIPIKSKFETDPIGQLSVTVVKSVLKKEIDPRFIPVFIIFPIILIAFSILNFFKLKTEKRKLWINVSYSLSFLLMTITLVSILINIYSDGIEGKTKALAESLSQRLNTALDLGLNLSDFDELDQTFLEYKDLNPDISFIALTESDIIKLHTDKDLKEKEIQHRKDHFEYSINISENEEKDKKVVMSVYVGIFKNIIYLKLLRSVKNFIVLFIATGFLAALFLNLIISINQNKLISAGVGSKVITEEMRSETLLNIIRPLYFLGIFIEGLYAAFLPQYFQRISIASQVNPNMISILFVAFFLAYGLSIIPGGKYAEKVGIKKALIISILFITASIILMSFITNFYLMIFVRILAGIGQGILLIGVQYYVLETAHKSMKTQGHSIIVVEYASGRLSGVAIGALVVNYIGVRGVFITGAVIGLLLIFYSFVIIPRIEYAKGKIKELKEKTASFLSKLKAVIKDLEFIKTSILIGINSKAIISGVIIFGLPLLMAAKNFYREDIGQILMFYSAGVMLASIYSSKLVDRIKKTKNVLFWGSMGSGIGLILIGIIDINILSGNSFMFFSTVILIFGIFLLGLSHGFINAPAVTHVTNSKAAGVLGRNSIISVSRSSERIGQVIGPIVVSQLLILNDQRSFTYAIIGMVTLVFSLIFIYNKKLKKGGSK